MERNHNPTAHDEMMRMLDECARLGKENAALRSLLGEWYALFAPVRREGTEGARLLDRTAEAMGSEFRYKAPNVELRGRIQVQLEDGPSRTQGSASPSCED